LREFDSKLTVQMPPPGEVAGPEAFWINLQGQFTAEQLRKIMGAAGAKTWQVNK